MLTRRNFSPSMPCTLRHFHSHISDAVKLFNSICIDMHFAITCSCITAGFVPISIHSAKRRWNNKETSNQNEPMITIK